MVGQVQLVVQVRPLVKEGVPLQGAHPAVAEDGIARRFVDAFHTQTDGCASHD